MPPEAPNEPKVSGMQAKLASSAMGSVPAATIRAAHAPAAAAAVVPAIKKPLLLVADFDDTIAPGAHSPLASLSATLKLRDILEQARGAGRHRVRLAINTGRTLALYEEAEQHFGRDRLPAPDALISGVGTRVHFAAGCDDDGGGNGGDGGPRSRWVEDAAWTQRMAEGWCRDAVAAAVDDLAHSLGPKNIMWQPPAEQGEHKATFLYHPKLRERLGTALQERLAAAGVQVTLVEGAAGCSGWRFVDVLPAAAGKGNAMYYVMKRLGFDPRDTVAAGDGANDLSMLVRAAPSAHAVCVGNAQPEVLAWAHAARGGGEGPPRVHVAAERAHAAAGVIEGLAAFGFI